jgi:hypothetical protein
MTPTADPLALAVRLLEGFRQMEDRDGRFLIDIEPVSVQSNRVSAKIIRRLEFGDQRPALEIRPA